jgi:hypothetical protein
MKTKFRGYRLWRVATRLSDFKRFLTDVLNYPQYNLNNYSLKELPQTGQRE